MAHVGHFRLKLVLQSGTQVTVETNARICEIYGDELQVGAFKPFWDATTKKQREDLGAWCAITECGDEAAFMKVYRNELERYAREDWMALLHAGIKSNVCVYGPDGHHYKVSLTPELLTELQGDTMTLETLTMVEIIA